LPCRRGWRRRGRSGRGLLVERVSVLLVRGVDLGGRGLRGGNRRRRLRRLRGGAWLQRRRLRGGEADARRAHQRETQELARHRAAAGGTPRPPLTASCSTNVVAVHSAVMV